MARVGQSTQLVVTGTLAELLDVDFGAPLHSFVIAGETHPLEEEFFEMYNVKHLPSSSSSSSSSSSQSQSETE